MTIETSADSAAAAVAARLRIVATTDLHAHLLPFDYYADRPLPATGLALAAALIRRLRAEAPLSILVDNGDVLQGSLLSDLLAADGDGGDGSPHPMIAAMNALGYDAGTLGNHEFNHGLPFLMRALGHAAFPVVSANVARADGSALVPPSAILKREAGGWPLRVGVLGLAPPQIAGWDAGVLAGAVATRDMLEAAAEEVARLRADGADLVVALAHTGIGAAVPEPMMENAAVPLAAIPGLDVVVAGHSHVTFPAAGAPPLGAPIALPVDPRGALHGKPAVQAGFFGSHVGVVDLLLAREADSWRVAAHRARALPVAEARADPAVAAIGAARHARLLDAARRPVGRSAVPLRSHFALVGPSAALDVVADAKRAEAARHLRGRPEEHLPLVVSAAPFRVGGRAGAGNFVDIPAGPLLLRHAAELYVHPNRLVLLEVTGADLLLWLERAASAFRTLVPGAVDQPLLDPAFPSYNFDTLDGLAWTVDPTRPPRTDPEGHVLDPGASRVSDLRHAGRPVAPRDRFVLATNSYRAGGGGGFAPATRARVVAETGVPVRDAMLRALRDGPLDPASRPRWRFAAHPGTAAWFDTGPGALRHRPEGRRVEPIGPAPNGFHRFRLWLDGGTGGA